MRVLNLVPVPNPQSGPGLVLAVQLESPADALEAEVYSPAMTLLVRDKHVGSYGAGWSRWTTADHGLGEGLYFFRARAFSGSRSSFWTKPQCLVVVR